LPVPVFLFDGQAQMVKANKAFLELAKAGAARLPQLSISDFFNVLKTFRFPVPDRYVTELMSADGKAIPVELNYTKFQGEDEESQGCLVFLNDLQEVHCLKQRLQQAAIEKEALELQLQGETPDNSLKERINLEKQLQEEKAFLENVIESCGDGIIIFAGKGTIARVNESFAKTIGKQKQEIFGNLYDLGPITGTFTCTTGETVTLDESYRDYTYRQVEKFISLEDGGKIENWEYYAFNSRGEIVPLDVTATMQKNPEGFITGSVCVLRDSTERKKAEKALKEAYRFRSQFFTNITHEFRTPLTLTIGPLEEILRGSCGKVSAAIASKLELTLRNSRRLLKLINQLLDLSMLESGAESPVYEQKDINAFTALILDSFSLIAQKKNITLTFNPCKDFSVAAIDPGKLEKVLFNLIGNAFKFTPDRGSISVQIRLVRQSETHGDNLTSKIDCNFIEMSVTDTGIGIRKEDLGTIFERFNRGGLGLEQEQGGAGIGLAYAKELAEVMGGRIAVASSYGRGATFSLYLPADTLQQTAADTTAGAVHKALSLQPEVELSDIAGQEVAVRESLSGHKPLMLIVDDNPDVRQYVADIIQNDYDFITAHNGKAALDRLEKHTPDIILCDVMMPEMDGYELLKSVKSRPGLRPVPFIFLTARADIEMKVEGLQEGADDYIVKPFNSLELLARLKSLLRIRDLLSTTEAQEKKITGLTQKLQEKYHYGNIIGSSPSMRKIYQLIDAIKDSDSSVLISGETGTGKELVANAIHYNSPRRSGPMVSVNCGAIPKELLASELFGHVRGAYTGAVESRKGYFQEADGGTLFLDEIGEMDKDMQVNLLRVLERGEIVRVGDTAPVKVNVRLIAATNKNLLEEVKKGRFREDLYYRIHVIPIHLPPLRQRRED
ncbi:MAG: sigma 54-interacting transcriptional regulator, partial [Proteobacteria bacterium]|nr:sigma 54-interacting transcriptional regulator [Pseudomonadota bacterium]